MSALFLLYVFCLIVGGAFVALSVVGGVFEADADIDVDADVDMDVDVDADVDADLDADADADAGGYDKEIEVAVSKRFNPFKSFKFYTFTLAFFGLTGTVFTLLNLWENETGVFVLASGMGLASGLGISYAMHLISLDEGSALGVRQYVGASGRVTLPIRRDKRGKVRMNVGGRTIEMLAEPADDEVVLDFDEECFVLGVEDGVAKVVDRRALESRASD